MQVFAFSLKLQNCITQKCLSLTASRGRAAWTRLAAALLGLQVSITFWVLPTPHAQLAKGEQTRRVISLNRSPHVSAFDHCFDYGFHGRQIDQHTLTLLTAGTKQTKENTVQKIE